MEKVYIKVVYSSDGGSVEERQIPARVISRSNDCVIVEYYVKGEKVIKELNSQQYSEEPIQLKYL